ncbi:hypothetical protein FHR33_009452 [Nonomuraea dietziae]|uniref:Uncharacterized protein n=1 Tax=Nonomuraea dietziae TaxID=65515 RepID=A0A7W5VH07_9ACTN|nr:hypothetical protein [Nonomuraea dietziae]
MPTAQNRPRARGVEDEQERHDAGDLRVPEEDDRRGPDGHQHVTQALEGGRRHVEYQVAHDAAAERGHRGQHRHAHHVEAFAHAHEGA